MTRRTGRPSSEVHVRITYHITSRSVRCERDNKRALIVKKEVETNDAGVFEKSEFLVAFILTGTFGGIPTAYHYAQTILSV